MLDKMLETMRRVGEEATEGEPALGDYVLATKYSDGDPCDGFCVGVVRSMSVQGRYVVTDNDGKVLGLANGFRRAEKIVRPEGDALVAMFSEVSDRPGPSLWDHLRAVRAIRSAEREEFNRNTHAEVVAVLEASVHARDAISNYESAGQVPGVLGSFARKGMGGALADLNGTLKALGKAVERESK